MTKSISNLPEVLELFQTKPGSAVYLTAVMRRMLLKVRTQQDLHAALAMIKVISDAPTILVAFCADSGLQPSTTMNLGWSEGWLSRYAARAYHEVDPIASALPGVAVPWSHHLIGKVSPNEKFRAYLRDCSRFGMDYGMSYVAEYNDCRIVLSMIGKHVEQDLELRHTLELLCPDVTDVAYRVLAGQRATSKLEKNQQILIDLICNQGLKKTEVAAALGMTNRGVDYHLKQLMTLYGARTVEQLMYRFGACE
ncbi:autoinducer binding domain-containing protein [Chromobacterium subtsugae]|uniref:autoinducer binding domain-containing protein n=1 Tax=Chromobacterium subtsugae TaxID=251747 RepID=UPI0007F93A2B|nr:autoinducer binding domain-containing protein [Chromobacterium subtsugae]OBU85847.1 hypothetical protein MY55_13505 [Chromobacterium subtsugae]